MNFPVVVQYRHVHLSKTDIESLFNNEELVIDSDLSHRGQRVYKQTVSISGTSGMIENVRILGPYREKTQIEISSSEASILGIQAPLRHSGDLLRAGNCLIKNGEIEIKSVSSVIVPAMHLHLNDLDAKEANVQNHRTICLQLSSRPEIVFEQVLVRVHPTFASEFHVSSDEAAKFWIQPNEKVSLC